MVTGVASPHRQLLGGPGWEGRLPHVPTAEGQEDGCPPSSPLRLLQQDRTFCGESQRRARRALPLLAPWEVCSRERSCCSRSRGRECTLLTDQHRPMQVGASSASHSRGQIEQAWGWGGAACWCAVINLFHSFPDRRGPWRAHAGRPGHR